MIKRQRLLLFFTLLTSLPVFSQNLYYPPILGNTWETLTPASQNFCPERVDSLYHFLETNNTKGFILLKDGKIVLEKYFGTFVQDSLWYWASAGKSLTGFLVGQAQEEGLLDIHDKTSDYLGLGWTSAPADKEEKITIWHQLTMTNGLDDTFTPTPSQPEPNLCKDPECLNYLVDAGTRWAYHTGPYRLLHDVLEAASNLSIQQFTKTRVLDATGMKGVWFQDVFYSRPRDMARFGLLVQGGGNWNGDVVLGDQAYLNAMTNTSQPLNKSYGYLWWLNGKPSFMVPGLQLVFPTKLIPNAPNDMIAALGKNDQKLHIAPSKGWVVVRMGNVGGFTSPGGDAVPIAFDNNMWSYLNQLECNASAVTETPAIQLQAAPNPGAEGWNISADNAIDMVELFDVQGRQVIQQTGNGAQSVWVSAAGLPSGVFYARVSGGGKVGCLRLLR